jgi:DNA-binding transcriptional ArsR family regulator
LSANLPIERSTVHSADNPFVVEAYVVAGEARDILAQWRQHSLARGSNTLSGPELAAQMADTFKVLSDPTRVLILQTLLETGQRRVGDLAQAVGMSQSSISHHLRILRHFRLVRTTRKGKEVYYSSDDAHVQVLLSVCAEHVTSDH